MDGKSTIFTKMTPNGKITLYIPQREFIDYLSWVQPIDGAIVIEQDYVHPDRAIAVQLMSVVRYGRQDDEVMGLNLSKEICLASVTVDRDPSPKHLTSFQKLLVEQYGDLCYPFHFEWPTNIGSSLFIQQPIKYTGDPCGMRHFLEVFCIYRGICQPHKRSSLHFDVDVIQMHGSTEKSAIWIPPATAVSRPLFCSPGRVDLEVCLEKTSVANGEPIVVNVSISNQSTRCIKSMKITLMQYYKLSFSEGSRKVRVASLQQSNGFPVAPGGTLNQTVLLIPRVPIGPPQEGLAVRRCTVSKTVALASSTLFGDTDPAKVFGFLISYRVRVKLTVAQSPLMGSVEAQVPVFIVAKKAPCNSGGKVKAFHGSLNDLKSCSESTYELFRDRRSSIKATKAF